MSFLSVRAGIHDRLKSIGGVRIVVAGMPLTIQGTPAFITQYLNAERIGQTNVFHWRFDIHAVLPRGDNRLDEDAIDETVDAVMAAFSPKLADSDGRPRSMLGGVAHHCWFERAASGDTDGYISFGTGDQAQTYRHILFTLVVKTTEAY